MKQLFLLQSGSKDPYSINDFRYKFRIPMSKFDEYFTHDDETLSKIIKEYCKEQIDYLSKVKPPN